MVSAARGRGVFTGMVDAVFGDDAQPADVACSVVTGRAGDVLETHHGGFELVDGMDGSDAEQIASGAALDAGRVADWLTGVSSSRQLCALPVPGSRRPFTVPGSDSLNALTRAAVAVVGELPEAATWVEEAEVACARFKAQEMQDRVLRLRQTLQSQR